MPGASPRRHPGLPGCQAHNLSLRFFFRSREVVKLCAGQRGGVGPAQLPFFLGGLPSTRGFAGVRVLQRAGADHPPLEYEDRGENFYIEMGHFDSQDDVDRAHPNGTYLFSLTAPSVRLRDVALWAVGTDRYSRSYHDLPGAGRSPGVADGSGSRSGPHRPLERLFQRTGRSTRHRGRHDFRGGGRLPR